MRFPMLRDILTYLFFALVLLASCSPHPEKDASKRIYSVSYKADVLDLEDCMEVEEIIPLEETDSSLVSFANKCLFTPDLIYMGDPSTRSILAFDKKGRYQFKINDFGQGDKEYTDMRDFCLSTDKRFLYILDQSSILKYDAQSGQFLSRLGMDEEISPYIYKFEAFREPDSFLLWSIEMPSALYTFRSGEMEKAGSLSGYEFNSQKFYRDSEDRLNFIPNYGRFEVLGMDEPAKMECRYALDFGEFTLPEFLIPENGTQQMECDEQPYFKCITQAAETGEWLYAKTQGPEKKYYHVFVSKKENRMLQGYNDPSAPLTIAGTEGDSFWGIAYPAYSSEDSFLGSIALNHKVGDSENPVLFRFHLK